ncbi:MAG TPA: hypothetical protein VF632_15570 [Longimicrobium sp.]|jgi:hypothetical protein
MEFLHNTRQTTDGERVRQAIQMADGKRLTRKRLLLPSAMIPV